MYYLKRMFLGNNIRKLIKHEFKSRFFCKAFHKLIQLLALRFITCRITRYVWIQLPVLCSVTFKDKGYKIRRRGWVQNRLSSGGPNEGAWGPCESPAGAPLKVRGLFKSLCSNTSWFYVLRLSSELGFSGRSWGCSTSNRRFLTWDEWFHWSWGN